MKISTDFNLGRITGFVKDHSDEKSKKIATVPPVINKHSKEN